jgi:RAB protein geranylgeranyltransferase component A
MKFLKFVMDYQSESQTELWQAHADEPLDSFLASEFKLDESLRSYVITLTLSLDGSISVRDGLAAISRHLNSMGVFGAGFAAVYPKWGGLSEVAQVGCRACAVGGGIYMLGTGIKDVQRADTTDADSPNLQISLADDSTIRARSLFRGAESASADHPKLARLTAVVSDAIPSVFEVVIEGAPTPSVAVVAFPAGSLSSDGVKSKYAIYAMVHSSDAGECPSGQCKLLFLIFRVAYPYLHVF